jgi:hypothetical protein
MLFNSIILFFISNIIDHLSLLLFAIYRNLDFQSIIIILIIFISIALNLIAIYNLSSLFMNNFYNILMLSLNGPLPREDYLLFQPLVTGFIIFLYFKI